MEYRIVLNRMEFPGFPRLLRPGTASGQPLHGRSGDHGRAGGSGERGLRGKAVNYLLVYETVREQMRVTQRTIERVSMNIMDALYARFPQIRISAVRFRSWRPRWAGSSKK